MRHLKENWRILLGSSIFLLDWLARVDFVYSHLANRAWTAGVLSLLQKNPFYIAVIGLLLIVWDIYDRRISFRTTGHLLIAAGGAGGRATVVGSNSGGIGGDGGQGGIGLGGPGGNAEVFGDNSFARGGDGGNAAQFDGRGGRRTQGPAEKLGLPSHLWRFGYGGAGANKPEYDRRLRLLIQIRKEYMEMFPGDVPFIEAGIDQVPIDWVNKRLEELDEHWRIKMCGGGYVLPPLQ